MIKFSVHKHRERKKLDFFNLTLLEHQGQISHSVIDMMFPHVVESSLRLVKSLSLSQDHKGLFVKYDSKTEIKNFLMNSRC
jgi:hypothetical protein